MPAKENGATISKQEQWQKLYGYMLGYRATWIADIGLKAGLFRAINDEAPNGIQEEALARKLSYKPRYVQVWCRAAFALEMLDWDERSGYRLAPHMASLLLDTSAPEFIGGRVEFSAALYEDFHVFPLYLKTGEAWPRSAHDPWLLQALLNQTRPDSLMIMDVVLPQAGETLVRLEAGERILDVGTGGGLALVHYARRFTNAYVEGIDSDLASVELARRTSTPDHHPADRHDLSAASQPQDPRPSQTAGRPASGAV